MLLIVTDISQNRGFTVRPFDLHSLNCFRFTETKMQRQGWLSLKSSRSLYIVPLYFTAGMNLNLSPDSLPNARLTLEPESYKVSRCEFVLQYFKMLLQAARR